MKIDDSSMSHSSVQVQNTKKSLHRIDDHPMPVLFMYWFLLYHFNPPSNSTSTENQRAPRSCQFKRSLNVKILQAEPFQTRSRKVIDDKWSKSSSNLGTMTKNIMNLSSNFGTMTKNLSGCHRSSERWQVWVKFYPVNWPMTSAWKLHRIQDRWQVLEKFHPVNWSMTSAWNLHRTSDRWQVLENFDPVNLTMTSQNIFCHRSVYGIKFFEHLSSIKCLGFSSTCHRWLHGINFSSPCHRSLVRWSDRAN